MSDLDYWAHYTPSGKTPFDFIVEQGYDYALAGENLYYGSGEKTTTERVVNLWVNSPGHYKNMVTPDYTEMAVCSMWLPGFQDTPDSIIIVNHFGRQM